MRNMIEIQLFVDDMAVHGSVSVMTMCGAILYVRGVGNAES